jgi:hypothetical protein
VATSFLDRMLTTRMVPSEVISRREAHFAGSRRLRQNARANVDHALHVPQQQIAVPRQEKIAVFSPPVPAVWVEKSRLLGSTAVRAGIMRARVAPIGAITCRGASREIGKHVAVVALEFPDAWKTPTAVSFRIRWVARLSSGSTSKSYFAHYPPCRTRTEVTKCPSTHSSHSIL